MKYMIISDIHGGINELNKVINIFNKESCSKLIILGDLFNYGIDLNKHDIINRLNLMKDSIIAVSGNCDNNLKDIMFDMPYYNEFTIENKKVFITHGHLYNKDYFLKSDSDIIITGHTHIPIIEYENEKLFINPGSITKSRSGDNSFAIIDENIVSIRNLDNTTLYSLNIK